MDSKFIKIKTLTLANISKVKLMVKEFLLGKMEKFMMGNGRWV